MTTVKSTLRKVRLWGIRGIINYLRAKFSDRTLRRFFIENSKADCNQNPGITIIGNLSARISVSKTLRDFAFSLRDAGIPFQTFDLGPGEIPEEDIKPILTDRKDFRIGRFDHVIELISTPLPNGIVPHRGRIIFWEFEHGLLETHPFLLERPGDVIGMSDFNVNYFAKTLNGKRRAVKILYPLRTETNTAEPKDIARRHFGFSPDDFIVFYNFSLDSGYHRKNPLGALKAFALAFRDVPTAKLVFKLSHVHGHEDRKREFINFAAANGFADRLILIENYLTQKDVFALTNACDIYLSTHRCEGFGLGIAEAMSMGKAVVVTDYSSIREFCNPDNAILVPAKIVPIKTCEYEHPWYRVAKEWAEPDISAAAKSLKFLYDNPAEIQRLGNNAKQFIADHFSIENFRNSVRDYLVQP